jgi:hypothetical protein
LTFFFAFWSASVLLVEQPRCWLRRHSQQHDHSRSIAFTLWLDEADHQPERRMRTPVCSIETQRSAMVQPAIHD